jgi:hypothetical protein
MLRLLTPRPKWYTPSKDYRTRGFDIVHVLDILAKYGRTHADSLIEVSDSLARFAFGVSVKEACMPRLKLELDPGHPERMRHDFNSGMVRRKEATALLFDLAPLSQRDGEIIRPYSALATGHTTAAVWFLSTYHVARRPNTRTDDVHKHCAFLISTLVCISFIAFTLAESNPPFHTFSTGVPCLCGP